MNRCPFKDAVKVGKVNKHFVYISNYTILVKYDVLT